MKFIIFLLSVLVVLSSCEEGEALKDGIKIFHQLSSEQTGVTFSNQLTETDSLNYFNYGYIYMGGGVAAGDINNDGLIDLFFTGNMVPNKLYLNKGNLKFEDISEKAGISGDKRWYTGVTMTDVNNDGLLDIYCSVAGKYNPKENVLYINNGDSSFTDKANKYKVADVGNSIQSTFFDYDLDGDLDLYVANYPPTDFRTPNNYYQYKMSNTEDVESDHLYRNDGETFTNVTDEAGLRSFGLTNSATVSDLNNDGWPDLYVSNDFSVPDYLYMNNADGTFTEHVKDGTKQTALFGMGVDIADYNNDGLVDIIQMDMTPGNNRRSKANMASMNPDLFWGTVNAGFGYQYMQNMLQLNNGLLTDSPVPNFSNVSRMGGLATTDWSWGPLFADLDNDGWKDIFITNGTRREINNKDYFKKIEHKKNHKLSFLDKTLAIPSEKIDNFVFRNNGDLTFEKANEKWGLTYKGFSNGSVYADLDNDGDLEIIINNVDDEISIFENTSSEKSNYLTLRFEGSEKNKFGLGVKVTIVADGMTQYQEMTLTRGFQSAVAPQLHFGLGNNPTVDRLTIKWPDGKQQVIKKIKSNQVLKVAHRDATSPNKMDSEVVVEKIFSFLSDTSILNHKHIENLYNDFENEVLIPHQTSMLGPNITVSDINGDGIDDIVIGGAKGQETAVYFQSKKGFIKAKIPAIDNDRGHEDLGILTLDVEGDGDNDIYIVSGGNEFVKDPAMLQDRLYINNGKGEFTKANTALPSLKSSGSRAYSIDFDKDGDMDILVCGRLVPGNYPQPADSYLLENVSTPDTPKFKDVTDTKAPGLKQLGMATSAIWSDIDGDGWDDLIVVGEWMPITVFKNKNGIFLEVTKSMELENTRGWWFSIVNGDFDNDGDMDFIVGNNGLNFKYRANTEETFDIYFNDFDKNDSGDIVLSYTDEGKEYPLRGRQCSSDQIPAIKKKYKDYESFADATLVDVYTKNDLEKSLHYAINSFASVYMENKNGKFVIHNLPNLAQVSSINQAIVRDFNNDSNLDVVLTGNLYMTEVETPRNDAGIGLLLTGDGKGGFDVKRGSESGLYAHGDIKDMSIIKIREKEYIIAAKNNDVLQFIEIK